MGNGPDDASPTYHLTRLVLLRGVAVVCLLAFLSLWVQIDGLIGSNGVLPFTEYLSWLERRLDAEAVRSAPTVLWWWPSDGGLHALCGVGVVASLCLLAGLLEGPSVAVLLVAYVSLSTVGQRFLGYQWDTLLVETLFVCLFLARWRTVRGTGPGPTRPAI